MNRLVLSVLFALLVLGSQAQPHAPSFPPPSAGPYQPQFNDLLRQLNEMPVAWRGPTVERYASQWHTPIIEQDSLLTFAWYGQAKTVQLCTDIDYTWKDPGNLFKLECGDKDLYFKSFILPTNARVDYSFVIDGVRIPDPNNPDQNPASDGIHSQAAMPDFHPTRWNTHKPNIQRGTLTQHLLTPNNAELLERSIQVYLPHGHVRMGPLPLVVVNDGRDALRFGQYQDLLDNLITAKLIQPMMVVFIPPQLRQAEYLTRLRPAYSNLLASQLIYQLNEIHPLSTLPNERLIMGVSNGGFLSLATAIEYPQVFGLMAGQSSTAMPALQKMVMNVPVEQLPKMYLDCGVYDITGTFEGQDFTFLDFNRDLVQCLRARNANYVYQEFNDGHQWANWRERTKTILVHFFGTGNGEMVRAGTTPN